MGQKLSRIIIVLFAVLAGNVFSQEDPADRGSEKEYKDGAQFEKFWRRRRTIGAWQINQLKDGALVVKLKANNLLVNALEKRGDKEGADVARIEAAGINVNLMRAFRDYYSFSKVYFVYSHQSDSLLKGVRKNIFLDSNLVVDPRIEMPEKFYMLAEIDQIYNSTIGFVPEDSARLVVERGSRTTEEPYIVVKNKYGHQLKKPFPYFSKIKAGLEKAPEITYIMVNGVKIPFNVVVLFKSKNAMSFNHNGARIEVFIPKSFIYSRLSMMVQNLNEEFSSYFQTSPPPRVADALKPFLY